MEFSIPASLLRELPHEPSDLLAVSLRLSQYAFAQSAAASDAEVSQIRAVLLQRQTELRATGRRCEELEAELVHSRAEVVHSRAEVERLSTEKATLVETVKSLSREVAKLDHFKRNLLATLSAEEGDAGHHSLADTVPPSHHGSPAAQEYRPARYDALPYEAPRAAAQPAPAVTGKDFFRSVRARLPADAYAQLLASIKSLNSHAVGAPQVLAEARALFGHSNADLYEQLQLLLASQAA
jgi:hypothetical protein